MKAGFIGCGNMGGALAAAAAGSAGGENILVHDHHPEKTGQLKEKYGCFPCSLQQAAEQSDLLFLGVKPQTLANAAAEFRGILAERNDHFTVISMAAGVDIASLRLLVGDVPIIRIMPNTAAAVGEGVILYTTGEGVSGEDESAFLDLMKTAGTCVKLPEEKIDMGSAISGCGPAFVCLMMEAVIDAGVRMGLSRAQAVLFTEQTFAGTARLALETGKDPTILRAEVCSPAGSTIEGVAALEAGAVRHAVMTAVDAAYRRTKELGK